MWNRITRKIRYIFAKFVLRNYYRFKYRRFDFKCDGVLINCRLNITGEGHKIVIAKGCVLKNVRIDITGRENVLSIDENSRFIESGRIRMDDNNGEVVIGKNLETSSIFLTTSDNQTSIRIGDNCLFSANIVIRSSDGHSILDKNRTRRLNPGGEVKIDDRVWIGYGVTILKGTHIGCDSVVGTQSVVSRLISPPHSLLAGIPAKIIKNNISWDFKRI